MGPNAWLEALLKVIYAACIMGGEDLWLSTSHIVCWAEVGGNPALPTAHGFLPEKGLCDATMVLKSTRGNNTGLAPGLDPGSCMH